MSFKGKFFGYNQQLYRSTKNKGRRLQVLLAVSVDSRWMQDALEVELIRRSFKLDVLFIVGCVWALSLFLMYVFSLMLHLNCSPGTLRIYWIKLNWIKLQKEAHGLTSGTLAPSQGYDKKDLFFWPIFLIPHSLAAIVSALWGWNLAWRSRVCVRVFLCSCHLSEMRRDNGSGLLQKGT